MKPRVAILISGGGSNMAALIAAARAPDFPGTIALVISNKAEAGGLARATAAGVPVAVVESKPFRGDREAFEAALQAVLEAHAIDFICLAGFMRVLTPGLVSRWERRMINIHPSLLPAYKGLDTHARALADGASEHGATVHWVVPDLDAGPIIAQARVPVLADDTPDSLAARVLTEEHRIYPQALRDVLTARG
jgi:formyltetrahydrofolate-dependent phosphoribosylglycinamide formyltransferase